MVRRGQAAMEYLMTYGWALLVIVVVLAALVYMGVLNPQSSVPETCNLQAGLMCNILSMDGNGNLLFEVSNHQPVNMENVRMACVKAGSDSSNLHFGSPANLNTGSSSKIACKVNDFSGNLGDVANLDIYMKYEVSGVEKTIKGTAIAKVSK